MNRLIRYPMMLACLLGLTSAGARQASWPVDAWLMTSFRGNGDGLHLAVSEDGLQWRDLDRVFLKPTVGSGLMRDPHLLRGPDGIFRLVWTTGWRDKGIGYASSTDLVHWSAQISIPVFEDVPGARTAWAPETVYDERSQQYIITWSSDIDGRFPETVSQDRMNHRTYYVTTKDFKTFSKPALLLDPGFDHIDTTLSRSGDKWIAVFKEGDRARSKVWGPIHRAVADRPIGPYRLIPEPLVREHAEGPTLVRSGDKTRLFLDYYTAGRYGVFESDDWKTWTDVSATAKVVPGQRHGTVLWVPPWFAQELEKAVPKAATAEPQPASPPILEGFTADPSIRVFGDTYYLYPTSDKPLWKTTDFSVWSSKNLVDWKKERMVLDVTRDLKWGNLEAWAPDVIERNGNYYLYFSANIQIGVATAKSPLGPFVDPLGKPLVAKSATIQTNPIDPYPFIDDDGQAYLYYGNGKLANVYKLKNDMVTLDGPPVGLAIKQFREGIVVFKRGGKYYFMWSIDDARSPNYRVGWGVADSPLGPVHAAEKDFIVLQRHGAAVGTAHHSVVNVPGTDRWYVAYHRHALPEGGGYQRQTMLARMEFDSAGNIKPMDPLQAPFRPGDVGEPVVNGKAPSQLPLRLPIDSVAMADADSSPEVKLDLPITPGPFEPTWESIERHYPGTPAWLREAKFGIWVHFGPQASGMSGDWYARKMYVPGTPAYENHLKSKGHPSAAGYKEVLRDWNPVRLDPARLTALYKDAGARFLIIQGVHHDNFDLWNSRHQAWNSTRIGARRDLVGEWSTAAKTAGLRYGVAFHHEYSWWWWQTAFGSDTQGKFAGVPYDGNLTLADGKGKWWEGLDPARLYNADLREYKGVSAAAHTPWSPPPAGLFGRHTAYATWYATNWAQRIMDVVEHYDPDFIYTDGTGTQPFSGSHTGTGIKADATQRVIADFYNQTLKRRGKVDTFSIIKFRPTTNGTVNTQEGTIPRSIKSDQAWIAETPVGDWYYGPNFVNDSGAVIRYLLEQVARDGNVAIAISPLPDGSLDAASISMLKEIGDWMRLNGAGIYGSKAWSVLGEGTTENGKLRTLPGGAIGKKQAEFRYGPTDFRFTVGKDGSLYAYGMTVPAPGSEIRIHSLGATANRLGRPVSRVTLLGHQGAPLQWKQEADALVIIVPASMPFATAVAFNIR